MRDADLAMNRRRFLLAGAGIAASVAIAPSLLEALDRCGPRRLFVPASPKTLQLNAWFEAPFTMTDEECAAMLRGFAPPQLGECRRSLESVFVPGTNQGFRVSVRREFKQEMWSVDAVGASRTNPVYVFGDGAKQWPTIHRFDDPTSHLSQWGRDVFAAVQREFS